MAAGDIRRAIREAREAAGLTLSELARRADVSHSHLLRYEAGTRDMSSDRLARVLVALGLDVAPLVAPAVVHPSSSS
jgi:transcriptional regulator with XRE-family HTH domain